MTLVKFASSTKLCVFESNPLTTRARPRDGALPSAHRDRGRQDSNLRRQCLFDSYGICTITA